MRAVLVAVGRSAIERDKGNAPGLQVRDQSIVMRLQREQQLRVLRADKFMYRVHEMLGGIGDRHLWRQNLDISRDRQARQPQMPDQPTVLDEELE